MSSGVSSDQGVPDEVDGAPLHESANGLHLPVPGGGLQGRAAVDRRAWTFDVGAGIEQCVDELDVVIARRPVQRGLLMSCPDNRSVGVRTVPDERADDLGRVRAMPRGVRWSRIASGERAGNVVGSCTTPDS